MLYEYQILNMFGGLKKALQEKREPTEAEVAAAFLEGLQIVASLVDSLNSIATELNSLANRSSL